MASKKSVKTHKTHAPVTAHKYTVDVNMGGLKVKSEGATIYEALLNLKLDKVVGKVSCTFSNGVKAYTMWFLRPIQLRRVLANNGVKKILEKRAKLFLGEK